MSMKNLNILFDEDLTSRRRATDFDAIKKTVLKNKEKRLLVKEKEKKVVKIKKSVVDRLKKSMKQL